MDLNILKNWFLVFDFLRAGQKQPPLSLQRPLPDARLELQSHRVSSLFGSTIKKQSESGVAVRRSRFPESYRQSHDGGSLLVPAGVRSAAVNCAMRLVAAPSSIS